MPNQTARFSPQPEVARGLRPHVSGTLRVTASFPSHANSESTRSPAATSAVIRSCFSPKTGAEFFPKLRVHRHADRTRPHNSFRLQCCFQGSQAKKKKENLRKAKQGKLKSMNLLRPQRNSSSRDGRGEGGQPLQEKYRNVKETKKKRSVNEYITKIKANADSMFCQGLKRLASEKHHHRVQDND